MMIICSHSKGKIGYYIQNKHFILGEIILGRSFGKKIKVQVVGAPLNIDKLIQMQITLAWCILLCNSNDHKSQ